MENYPVPEEYTWKYKITSYDVGLDRRLKLSNQLKLQQEVGEIQLDKGGLGYNNLYDFGFAFVLTHLNTVIYKAPVFGETIQLRTWSRGTKGIQFFRCYQFLDSDGNLLIDSVTAFALVDTLEHKLLRPNVFDRFGVRCLSECNSCPDPSRLKLPEGMEYAGTRTIRWSDIDYNGHVNNSVYADIACDAIPGGMQNKHVTMLSISFLHEALEGNDIILKTTTIKKDNKREAYISGSIENQRCFDARICYIDE